MNKDLIQEFLNCLKNLPSKQAFDDSSVSYYTAPLMQVPDEIGSPLLNAVRMNCAWRPTFAELKDMVAAMVKTHTTQTAAEAYFMATELERRIGPYCTRVVDAETKAVHYVRGEPSWKHQPLIGLAVAGFGGWQKFCDEDNETARRAHFLRFYEAALAGVKQSELRRMYLDMSKMTEITSPQVQAPGQDLLIQEPTHE